MRRKLIPIPHLARGVKKILNLLGWPLADINCAALPITGTLLTGWAQRTPLTESAAASLAETPAPGGPTLLLKLLGESVPNLRNLVDHYAERSFAAGGMSGARRRSPEQWAAEFLHLARVETEPQAFLARAEISPYARHGSSSRLLVLTAAAYAWRLHQDNPDYAVPGSLRRALASYSPQSREAFLQNTAAYHTHSYAVEGETVSREQLQSRLEQALMPVAA